MFVDERIDSQLNGGVREICMELAHHLSVSKWKLESMKMISFKKCQMEIKHSMLKDRLRLIEVSIIDGKDPHYVVKVTVPGDNIELALFHRRSYVIALENLINIF